MKVNSSLSTKRKRPKAVRNRADATLDPSINTLSANRSPVERLLVIDIGGRSMKDPCHRANAKSVVSIWANAHTGTDGGGSKEVSFGLDI
jgi:hypothetical protein